MDPQSFLTRIIEKKRDEIRALNQDVGLHDMIASAQTAPTGFKGRFFEALSGDRLKLIAEVKKASPSRGIIRENFDPVELARLFEKQGATAVSVLTERQYFQGHPDFLTQIKAEIDIPVLRKDFILDPIQIAESKQMGADAILLIKAILSDDEFVALHRIASQLELDVLVEVHTQDELDRVLNLDTLSILGINNRNLSTFEVEIRSALRLKEAIDRDRRRELVMVAESGYFKRVDLDALDAQEFNAVLIGEGLAKSDELDAYFSEA